MSDTLSAIVSTVRGKKPCPALHVGLVGDAPHQPPARFGLAGLDRIELGRGEVRRATRSKVDGANVLALTIVDGRMSSQHARLTRVGGVWVLDDLGSKNGTWSGTQRITRHSLADGDAFILGHTALVFRDHGGDAGDLEALVPPLEPGLATMSPTLRDRFAELAHAAKSEVPIEITGESGTGKELIARAVHRLSGRSGSFVAVNCGAIAPNLIEAELFGHKKGAFTGAGEGRLGLLREADGGTLFLDEIGELPPPAQTSLLRVIQEREVLPLGADRPIKINLRIVTATHRNLDRDVDGGRFRADLRARLLGISFELPPLRVRGEDLGHVITTLLARLAPERAITFTADAVAVIYTYPWPLNIRELERALAAALAIAKDRIELQHLPGPARPTATAAKPTSETPPSTPLTEEEEGLRVTLVASIARHDGNLAAVARELGKDRTQIRRWMKRLGMSRPDE